MSNINDLNFNVSGSIDTTVRSKPGSTGKYDLWFNGTSFSSSDGTMRAGVYWCSAEVAEMIAETLSRSIDIKQLKRHFSSHDTRCHGYSEISRDEDTTSYVRDVYPDIYRATLSLLKDGRIRNEPYCGSFYYVKV